MWQNVLLRKNQLMIDEIEAKMQEGKFDEAMVELIDFVANHPVHPKGYALLGMCHGRKGDIDAATEHFGRAWALDPTDWSTGKNLIKCFEYKGQHKEALAVAYRIERLRPSDKENKEAIDRFRKILNIQDPVY